jgi:hypothetical protein
MVRLCSSYVGVVGAAGVVVDDSWWLFVWEFVVEE